MVDTLPLYDSAGDEPLSKYPESTGFFKPEYIDCGKQDYSMIIDGAVGSEHPLDSTSLIVEPLNSVPVEGEPVGTQQEFPQMDPSLNYNIGSGNAANKRSTRHVPKSRSKHAGKKHVNGKNVAKLFASKEAQEEIIKCEVQVLLFLKL